MPGVTHLTGNESAFWSHADAVAWYEQNRNSYDELYPSEKQYINASLFALGSHLDVGCAAGGLAMCCLWKSPVSLNGKPFEPGEVWAVPVGR